MVSIENTQWGQFIDIDYENNNTHNQKLHLQKNNSIKYRKKTPPCILEDEIYYDDLVRTYSSEIIPPDYQLIERATPPNSTIIKNDFVKHPMFAISSLFYYCAELFWK